MRASTSSSGLADARTLQQAKPEGSNAVSAALRPCCVGHPWAAVKRRAEETATPGAGRTPSSLAWVVVRVPWLDAVMAWSLGTIDEEHAAIHSLCVAE